MSDCSVLIRVYDPIESRRVISYIGDKARKDLERTLDSDFNAALSRRSKGDHPVACRNTVVVEAIRDEMLCVLVLLTEK